MKQISLLLLSLYLSFHLDGQSFTKITTGDIVNTASGSRSANFIDVNGDGWDDIFISNGPSSGQNNMLYLNNQDGTFTTVTNDPIVNDGAKSDGATFGDANNDGALDAYVVTWYGQKNNYYLGQSSGGFTSQENILNQVGTYSETASWGDMDNDGWLDLYVTNSEGIKRNKLFQNLGNGDFKEITSGPMVESTSVSRSIDWIDYDNDGDSDIFVTNESNQRNELFQNNGSGSFTKITNLAMLNSNRSSAGSSWGDIDNDGDFDLFVGNYEGQANELYINNGDGTFTTAAQDPIAQDQGWAFGSAFADADNDGDLDLVLANCKNDNQKNSLFKNNGNNNNWFKLSCEGVNANHSAIGAVVKAKATINGLPVWQTRRIAGQSGYNCQNTLTVHFGLGDATIIDSLVINWGPESHQVFENIAINAFCKVKEGESIECKTTSTSDIKLKDQNFKIFPNPSNGRSIEFENPFPPNQNDLELKVFDFGGKEIFHKMIDAKENRMAFENLNLSPGTYQVILTQDDKIRNSTLVIQ